MAPPRTSARARAGDWRNGYDPRWLDTGFGPVRLGKPKVRGCAQPFGTLIFERCQRRIRHVQDCVRRWVSGGLGTRVASAALSQAFGIDLSAGGVSVVMGRLEQQIRALHTRPLPHAYGYVFFDGKWGYTCHRRRPRGRGKNKQGVLPIAWGMRHDGREERIDFSVADRENEASGTGSMTDLERRGLKVRNRWNQTLETITTDGDGGLVAGPYTLSPPTRPSRGASCTRCRTSLSTCRIVAIVSASWAKRRPSTRTSRPRRRPRRAAAPLGAALAGAGAPRRAHLLLRLRAHAHLSARGKSPSGCERVFVRMSASLKLALSA